MLRVGIIEVGTRTSVPPLLDGRPVMAAPEAAHRSAVDAGHRS
jgi:hypothetical protein